MLLLLAEAIIYPFIITNNMDKTGHDSPGQDSRAIANIFVEKWQQSSDGPMTIMMLLKYVYFAHGWTLGNTGKPLICHTVQAWKYGPVVPEVYYAFKHQPIRNITEMEKEYSLTGDGLTDTEANIIENVYRKYSKLPAMRLSAMTHAEGTPWYRFRNTFYGTIPNAEIERYYKDLVEKLKQQ